MPQPFALKSWLRKRSRRPRSANPHRCERGLSVQPRIGRRRDFRGPIAGSLRCVANFVMYEAWISADPFRGGALMRHRGLVRCTSGAFSKAELALKGL